MRPTVADRDRVAESLHVRVAGMAGVVGLSSAATISVAKAHTLGLSWPVLSAVVGLATGGLFIAAAHQSDATRDLGTTASAVMAPAPVAAPALAPLDAPVDPPAPSRETETRVAADQRPAIARRPQADRLAEEVEILSRAQTELHAGRFAGSLRLLEEHARKFPRGTLAQERRATRIQALCGMGRTTEAEAELARLAPRSVHEPRSRKLCAASVESR